MAESLEQQLIRHEGLKLKPYRCTAGALTIGVGHNLDANGIPEYVAMALLAHDIAICRQEIQRDLPWSLSLPQAAQNVLVNMGFMGVAKLRKFTKFLAALEARNYVVASQEMLNSKWAKQVGKRSVELADIIRGLSSG